MKKMLCIIACGLATLSVSAQAPKWAEKARKGVFSVVTYDKDNQIKGTGNGFYIDANGTALSDFSLFENAQRAVIINADGKQTEVESILGANGMYDVVKFRTPIDKKQTTLTLANQPAKVDEIVYLLPYSTQKAATIQTGRVTAVDTIGDKFFYYTLEMKTGEKLVSCPVMNANGEVLGLIQKNASDESNESYAIGARYGAALEIFALSMNDGTLNSIGIKKALPDTEEQALVTLFMASGQLDADSYLALLNDFLQQYPNSYDGYIRRATQYMHGGNPEQYPLAEADLKKALDVATNKAEAHYGVAKAIYGYLLTLDGKEPYGDWSYDKALEILQPALKDGETSAYLQLEGDILFAQGKYADAFNSYDKLSHTELASAATFYSAAKAKQLTEGSDINEVIALMDSAIVRLNKPYGQDAAGYFYERADANVTAGKYRNAVVDYNTFYDAMLGNVNALFYYQREQAEMQCRMYKQALDDINHAVELAPEDVDFWIEKGSVHLRVNQMAEAEEALTKALSLDANNAVTYRMLGYAQALQKKLKEAKANFTKAKELGDTVVDQLIEKYCK